MNRGLKLLFGFGVYFYQRVCVFTLPLYLFLTKYLIFRQVLYLPTIFLNKTTAESCIVLKQITQIMEHCSKHFAKFRCLNEIYIMSEPYLLTTQKAKCNFLYMYGTR